MQRINIIQSIWIVLLFLLTSRCLFLLLLLHLNAERWTSAISCRLSSFVYTCFQKVPLHENCFPVFIACFFWKLVSLIQSKLAISLYVYFKSKVDKNCHSHAFPHFLSVLVSRDSLANQILFAKDMKKNTWLSGNVLESKAFFTVRFTHFSLATYQLCTLQ